MLAQLLPRGAGILSKFGDKSRNRILVVSGRKEVACALQLATFNPGLLQASRSLPYLVTIKSFPWLTYFRFVPSATTCNVFPPLRSSPNPTTKSRPPCRSATTPPARTIWCASFLASANRDRCREQRLYPRRRFRPPVALGGHPPAGRLTFNLRLFPNLHSPFRCQIRAPRIHRSRPRRGLFRQGRLSATSRLCPSRRPTVSTCFAPPAPTTNNCFLLYEDSGEIDSLLTPKPGTDQPLTSPTNTESRTASGRSPIPP